MNTKQIQYLFTSPVVPIADGNDGLLKTADLDRPVSVEILVWDAAEPGYYFQLMLNGELVGATYTVSDADKSGDIVVLSLDEKLLYNSGSYQLTFLATNPSSELSSSPEAITLLVDRTPPGAALLAPLILPGNKLSALLPGYAGMAPGDVIQTRCNGLPGPAYTVRDEDLGIHPIEIIFEREYLDLGGEHLTLDYTVTDRAGNVSARSVPKRLSLQM